jgi:hypothetical protein
MGTNPQRVYQELVVRLPKGQVPQVPSNRVAEATATPEVENLQAHTTQQQSCFEEQEPIALVHQSLG